MENKEELEKLVEEFKQEVLRLNESFECAIPASVVESFRAKVYLADKQGYLRGVEEALRILPETYTTNSDYSDYSVGRFDGSVAYRTEAHDAISKLKENA